MALARPSRVQAHLDAAGRIHGCMASAVLDEAWSALHRVVYRQPPDDSLTACLGERLGAPELGNHQDKVTKQDTKLRPILQVRVHPRTGAC